MATKYLALLIIMFLSAQTFVCPHNTETPAPIDYDVTFDYDDGATIEISVNQENVKEYAAEAVKMLTDKYPGNNHLIVKEIIRATETVVAGMHYEIAVTVGTSNCPKEKELKETCTLLEDGPEKVCDIIVWVQSWMKFKEIKITCNE